MAPIVAAEFLAADVKRFVVKAPPAAGGRESEVRTGGYLLAGGQGLAYNRRPG